MSNPLSLPVFRHISDVIRELGVEAYVIGGYVRDYYLGRPCDDVDIVVVGSGIEVAQRLGKIGLHLLFSYPNSFKLITMSETILLFVFH